MVNQSVSVVDADSASSAAVAQMLRGMGLDSAVYPSAAQFLEHLDPAQPGCLILEVRIPGMNGLQLQEQLIARRSPLPLVFLTQHATVAIAVRAMRAGAVHFLEKPFREAELRQAVTEALVLDDQRRTAFSTERVIRQRLARLDQQERRLARHLVDGMSNRQIARKIGVCVRTVELRRSRMMRKLQVANVSELVPFSWALEIDGGEKRVPPPSVRIFPNRSFAPMR